MDPKDLPPDTLYLAYGYTTIGDLTFKICTTLEGAKRKFDEAYSPHVELTGVCIYTYNDTHIIAQINN